MYTDMSMELQIGTISPNQQPKIVQADLKQAKPFVKWVGGKGQLLGEIERLMPPSGYRRYYEPFLGGGALFFKEQPKIAFINDINKVLIGTYLNIKSNVNELVSCLKILEAEYKALSPEQRKEYFYSKRQQYNEDVDPFDITKSVLLIFLNRTCFNGMYRENSKGHFNVPFGDNKNPTICNEDNLRSVASLLRGTTPTSNDFADVVEGASEGDFVYFDPPYAPLSATSSFTSYSSDGFTSEEQKRLRDLILSLRDKGVNVMLSNSHAGIIRELYDGHGLYRHEVMASRAINSKAAGRGKIKELIYTTYKPHD